MNKEELQNLVKTSSSLSDIIRRQGKAVSGTSMKLLKQELDLHQIDYHFMPDKSSKKLIPLEDILVNGSNYQSSKLLQRLISEGLKKNECENPKCPCKNGYWLDNPLICQLHHINGDNRDNRLENLQMLCPNCHSQTDNYCGQANKAAKYFCELCGAEKKTKAARYCPKCAAKMAQKVDLPDKQNFINKFKELKSFVAVGKFYNVSDTTIRKWCKKYEIPYTKKELVLFLKDSN